MPTSEHLLTQLRLHLASLGLARDPDDGSSDAHPMWLQPKGGAVAPGDKAAPQDDYARPEGQGRLVVTARQSGELAAPRYGSDRRIVTVDLWYRCTHAPLAHRLQALHRLELVGDLGRRNWSLAGMTIVESIEWAGMRPTTAAEPHSFIWTPLFEFWA